ncbi:hypothetical protein MTP03_18470 [Tsukamurella sp. PLM1]|nr:hypothetical protein MTP03_18470 [Tsukamurella sp. PLM1]
MGYDATFEGEFKVVPLLSAAERKRLAAFSKERHEDPSMPGYWCNWVPNKQGTALVWNGSEKFYRSAAWLRYLIKEFLAPAGHRVSGNVTATGQDGAVSTIVAIGHDVHTHEVRGPMPTEYALIIEPRHQEYDLDREYDAAFDLSSNQFSLFDPGDPQVWPKVTSFAVEYPDLDLVVVDDTHLVDEVRGLTLEVWSSGTMIVRLLASVAMADPDRAFSEAIDLATAVATLLNWTVYDPAQRVALRPTDRFRKRAISRIRGYMQEVAHFPRASVV